MYQFSIPPLQAAFDYEHEHRFTEHEYGGAEREHGVAEREYFVQTRCKSKPATRIPEEPFFCKP
jgi:hypothetical protein